METQLLMFLSLIAATAALSTPTPHATGPPLPTVPGCNVNTSILSDSSPCSGRPDGNYDLVINNVTFKNNFLSCVNGIAYCRPCPDPAGPLLYYSEVCDQCLLPADAMADNCFTTEPTGPPPPPPDCPTNSTANDEQCSELGSDFCGNRVDYRMNPMNNPSALFLMCYNGKYVDCMACQPPLLFRELRNFKGKYDIYGHCA